ncbi:MAG: hypothetical protein D4R67_11975 [Bacteroidetes bacterium]|nr:MAG: hypothetical protein D4R67_11975 [Bacteroidota bacterium]
MARILTTYDSSWYDELNSVASYSETDFERRIKQHISKIFPDYISFGFKKTVQDNTFRNRPDLAMIRKDYKEWYIIEVELGSDYFPHVKRQIETFINGDYNPYSITEYIVKKIKEGHPFYRFDRQAIFELVSSTAPNVIVMVDRPKDDWFQEIDRIGGKNFIFQIYKNPKGTHHLFRLDGFYPKKRTKEVHCSFHKVMLDLLEIHDQEILLTTQPKKKKMKTFLRSIPFLQKLFPTENPDELLIRYKDQLTSWGIVTMDGRLYLKFLGRVNPLPPEKSYVLFKDSNDNFHIDLN